VDKNRLWIIGSVAAMVVVVALGLLFGIQPQLTAAVTADQQRQTVAADNATKLAQLHKLESDFKQLPALKESLKQLAESVPSHPDLAAMISNLDALAAGTGTTIESIAVKDAQPYAPPAVTPAPASGTPGSTATPTSTPAPTAAPTATPAKPRAPAPVTNSQVTAANFVAIPVTISVNGTYGQALNFVDGLQHGKRLFLVTTFASTKSAEAAAPAPAPTPGSTSGSSSGSSSAPTQAAAAPSWTVGGYVYVVLDSTKKAVPSQ
jgi:Tfp pilus assembly protein PilO